MAPTHEVTTNKRKLVYCIFESGCKVKCALPQDILKVFIQAKNTDRKNLPILVHPYVLHIEFLFVNHFPIVIVQSKDDMSKVDVDNRAVIWQCDFS